MDPADELTDDPLGPCTAFRYKWQYNECRQAGKRHKQQWQQEQGHYQYGTKCVAQVGGQGDGDGEQLVLHIRSFRRSGDVRRWSFHDGPQRAAADQRRSMAATGGGSAMTSDDSRGDGRKPRPIPPPRVPPSPLREFKRYVYRLYLAAGAPSLEKIVALVAEDDSLPGSPGRDTVNRLLGGAKLPGLPDAESVASVLARMAGNVEQASKTAAHTRQLWIDAKESPVAPLRTAAQWGAAQLGVHHAAAVDGTGSDTLTPYIERKHDETLRDRLQHAAAGKRSVLAVLVGHSSTGKSRAAFEAVLSELPNWPVLFPSDPIELMAWIATDSIDARTVVWLNEAQRYLSGTTGDGAARALKGLLGTVTPVAVIGSMWPEYLRNLTARSTDTQDEHFHARFLLEVHRAEIHVPDNLGGRSLRDARKVAAHDPRIAAALAAARQPAGAGARVIQQLTGGPELVKRYDSGPGGSFSEIEYAVITAAVDARRLGHLSALPGELIADAAAGYLPTTGRVTHDREWFTAAVKALSPQSNGFLSALVPDRVEPGFGAPDGYHPADFLDQYVRRVRAHLAPPPELWEAAIHRARSADDLYAMGQSAQQRRRYAYAMRFYRGAIERGSTAARPALSLLLEELGDGAGAESVAANSPQAWVSLAMARENTGDREGAQHAYSVAVREGDPWAWAALTRIREVAGDRQGAEETAAEAAESGNAQAWQTLARLRERRGDSDGAMSAYRRAAEAGEPWGWIGLARLCERAGDRTRAATVYETAAAAGITAASAHLVHLCWEVGDKEGAERAAVWGADHGDAEAWSVLARFRGQHGDLTGADRAYTLAAAVGASSALTHLARLREEGGDRPGAERAAGEASQTGDSDAWNALARLREEQGDGALANLAAAEAARIGDTNAWMTLARLREGARDRAGAERAANEAAESGDPEAWSALSRIRERAGDREASESAARRAAEVGSTGCWTGLGREREQQGDVEAAERAYTVAAELGDPDAWGALGRLYEETGNGQGAERAYKFAVDAGDTEAWEGLLRTSRGHRHAPQRGMLGLNADGGYTEAL